MRAHFVSASLSLVLGAMLLVFVPAPLVLVVSGYAFFLLGLRVAALFFYRAEGGHGVAIREDEITGEGMRTVLQAGQEWTKLGQA
jgi:uncharacterized membrane protein